MSNAARSVGPTPPRLRHPVTREARPRAEDVERPAGLGAKTLRASLGQRHSVHRGPVGEARRTTGYSRWPDAASSLGWRGQAITRISSELAAQLFAPRRT